MYPATTKLKERARRHEQARDWEGAIRSYLEVIELCQELDVEPDLAIYNRVGDLYLRLGRVEDAVEYYELAADHYGAAGLGNNAIALCSKALRYQPNRASLYRKLARFCAQQGFRSDARRWFLEYAVRMESAGTPGEAIAALSETPGLAEDAELHRALARRWSSRGRRAEAAAVLRRAYDLLVRADEPDAAADVAEELAGIDPDATPGMLAANLPGDGPPRAREAPTGSAGLGLESVAAAAGIDAADGGAAVVADLPLLPAAVAEPWTENGEACAGAAGLPLILPGADDAESAREQAPPVAAEAGPGDAGAPEGAGDGSDAARILVAADEFAAAGEDERAAAELERGHAALAAAGKVRDALEVATALSRLRPDDEAVLRARVEYASRIPGRAELPEALLALAEHLEGRAATRRAAAVYRQILEIDPGNSRARRGLDRLERRAGRAAGGVGDASTRFKLPEKPPSGDDARDFAEMLAEFKRQLARGIGRDDPASHCDLGIAFREMGLVDEAIAEFQAALRAGAERLRVYEELGACFLLSGRPHVAEKVLRRALDFPPAVPQELAGIHHLLGRCYEALGRGEQAAEAFRAAAELDPRIAGAGERGPGL